MLKTFVNHDRTVSMKIQGTGPLNTPSIRRRDAVKRQDDAGFASAIGGQSPAKGPGAASPVESLSNIFSVQEVDDRPGGRNQQARQRGEFLLDKLERLRHSLLAGTIAANDLADLARAVRARRALISDPRVAEVLDEIELRAAVELAKLGQAP